MSIIKKKKKLKLQLMSLICNVKKLPLNKREWEYIEVYNLIMELDQDKEDLLDFLLSEWSIHQLINNINYN
jgi:hypothetical protein